mgnify:CR=1 FL=1
MPPEIGTYCGKRIHKSTRQPLAPAHDMFLGSANDCFEVMPGLFLVVKLIMPPKNFIELCKVYNISYDDFIRTTEKRHEKVVNEIITLMYKNKFPCH